MYSTPKLHLISPLPVKYAITIDPERVEVILALPLPAHKKGLQNFIGRIEFGQEVYTWYSWFVESSNIYVE